MATRMVRKQIYITDDQERRLKYRAESEGRSEAEIVRECIDQSLSRPAARSLSREESWARQVRFMKERLSLQVPQRERTWRREDLYEERLSRLAGQPEGDTETERG